MSYGLCVFGRKLFDGFVGKNHFVVQDDSADGKLIFGGEAGFAAVDVGIVPLTIHEDLVRMYFGERWIRGPTVGKEDEVHDGAERFFDEGLEFLWKGQPLTPGERFGEGLGRMVAKELPHLFAAFCGELLAASKVCGGERFCLV